MDWLSIRQYCDSVNHHQRIHFSIRMYMPGTYMYCWHCVISYGFVRHIHQPQAKYRFRLHDRFPITLGTCTIKVTIRVYTVGKNVPEIWGLCACVYTSYTFVDISTYGIVHLVTSVTVVKSISILTCIWPAAVDAVGFSGRFQRLLLNGVVVGSSVGTGIGLPSFFINCS